jgi:predicted cobalt transporter CbtA
MGFDQWYQRQQAGAWLVYGIIALSVLVPLILFVSMEGLKWGLKGYIAMILAMLLVFSPWLVGQSSRHRTNRRTK